MCLPCNRQLLATKYHIDEPNIQSYCFHIFCCYHSCPYNRERASQSVRVISFIFHSSPYYLVAGSADPEENPVAQHLQAGKPI